MGLGLSVDEVLTTTRSVRKRLDFDRPVDPLLIRECLQMALQAPNGSNAQNWEWVVVTDAAKKRALADLYRMAWARYLDLPQAIGNVYRGDNPEVKASYVRTAASGQYLADNLERVPAFVIPCLAGRTPGKPSWLMAAAGIGSIVQAGWSFMLAARERCLGTCWTTLHLMFEEQAAGILGIPYDRYLQIALIPVAYSKGTDFRAGTRKPLDEVLHWDGWNGATPT